HTTTSENFFLWLRTNIAAKQKGCGGSTQTILKCSVRRPSTSKAPSARSRRSLSIELLSFGGCCFSPWRCSLFTLSCTGASIELASAGHCRAMPTLATRPSFPLRSSPRKRGPRTTDSELTTLDSRLRGNERSEDLKSQATLAR